LRIESRGRFGVGIVFTIVGIGDASGMRTLDEGNRLGVLKFGVGGE
jgi:hypothetical protein